MIKKYKQIIMGSGILQIAKKKGADTKKTFSYVLFFGLLGWLPRYINKTK